MSFKKRPRRSFGTVVLHLLRVSAAAAAVTDAPPAAEAASASGYHNQSFAAVDATGAPAAAAAPWSPEVAASSGTGPVMINSSSDAVPLIPLSILLGPSRFRNPQVEVLPAESQQSSTASCAAVATPAAVKCLHGQNHPFMIIKAS